MNKFQKALHIASWFGIAIFALVFLLLPSLVMVPLMLLFSRDKNNRDVPKWFPWGNNEEGCPDWWLNREKPWIKDVFPRFWWFVVRNPFNNSRYWIKDRPAKYITNWDQSIPMEAQQMIDAGVKRTDRWAYSGMFAGYRVVWLEDDGTYSERWFGWKVGSSVDGMGFTLQNRRHIEVGK